MSFESELRQIGVDKIRVIVESGAWKTGSPGRHGEAVEVVRRFDAAQAAASSAKRDAREEETLSIARKALSIAETQAAAAAASADAAREQASAAKSQARWAMWAAIIAVIAAAIATKDQILALIFKAS